MCVPYAAVTKLCSSVSNRVTAFVVNKNQEHDRRPEVIGQHLYETHRCTLADYYKKSCRVTALPALHLLRKNVGKVALSTFPILSNWIYMSGTCGETSVTS